MAACWLGGLCLSALSGPGSVAQGLGRQRTPAFRTAIVDFQRTWTPRIEGASAESSLGRIYHRAPDRTLVQVKSPIEQVLEVQGKHLRIYYPKDGRAFDLQSDGNQRLPFLDAFLGAIEEDFGLSTLGYVLAKHEARHDTLVTVWNPPAMLAKVLGKATLAKQGGHLALVEMRDPKGNVLTRYYCSDSQQHAGLWFPGRVRLEILTGDNAGTEELLFSNLELNAPLPEWVQTFQLPANAEVKRLQ